MRRPRFLWVIVLTLGLAPAEDLEAQIAGERVWLGLLGGGTYTKFTGSSADAANLEWRTGFAAGGFIQYQVSPRFGIALEGMLIQKGARREQVTTTSGLAYRLWYVDVPLLARFTLAPDATLRPTIVVGPSVGFEVDCKEKIAFNNAAISATCSEPPERRSTDFSGNVGLEIGWRRYAAGVRYFRSFTEVHTGASAPELRNHGFSLIASVRF